ncbi:MAG TPA: hypothetical protein DHV48_06775, partial [Prolixibacteraceae bacterium]|nr:hypothetical protein [Prolixibacteraceae bacterium]
MLFLLLMAMSMVGTAQTLTLDQADMDYAPGETVYITGSDFEPGETVSLTISHIEPGLPLIYHEHTVFYATTNEEGSFNASWYVNDVELNTTLLLTAEGDMGSLVSTVFTDAVSVTPFNIGVQTGVLTAGNPGTVTYSCSVKTTGNPDGATVNLAITGLPTGVTFSPSSFFTEKNETKTFTLSLSTTTATPNGIYSFSVSASGTDITTANQTGTLTIGACTQPNNTTTGFTGSPICAGENGILTFDADNTGFAGPYTIVYTDGTTSWTQSISTAASTPFNVAVNPTSNTTYTLVKITNAIGCERTASFGKTTAQILVKPLPVGSASPQTICSGTATSIALSSTIASSTFTWTAAQQSGATITGFVDGSGTTIAQTLTNTGNTLAGVVRYTVIPTSPAGCAGASFTVDVTVNSTPAITTQPTAQTVTYGDDATFTAAASGTPAPTYQWQVNTGSDWTDVPSATSSTLTVVKPTVAMSGYQYQCVATNTCGTATSNGATLTVNQLQLTVADPTLTKTKTFDGNTTAAVTAGDLVNV